jgi:serine/threonine protein kinase
MAWCTKVRASSSTPLQRTFHLQQRHDSADVSLCVPTARHIPTGQIVALKKVGGRSDKAHTHQIHSCTSSCGPSTGHSLAAALQVRFSGSKEGLPVTSVRELAILQQARHPNIVSLLKVVTGTRPDRCARACGTCAME